MSISNTVLIMWGAALRFTCCITFTTVNTFPTASPKRTNLHVSCADQTEQECASWCRVGASWCKKGVLAIRNCTKATRTCTEFTYMLTKQSVLDVIVPSVPTPTCTKSCQTDGNVSAAYSAQEVKCISSERDANVRHGLLDGQRHAAVS